MLMECETATGTADGDDGVCDRVRQGERDGVVGGETRPALVPRRAEKHRVPAPARAGAGVSAAEAVCRHAAGEVLKAEGVARVEGAAAARHGTVLPERDRDIAVVTAEQLTRRPALERWPAVGQAVDEHRETGLADEPVQLRGAAQQRCASKPTDGSAASGLRVRRRRLLLRAAGGDCQQPPAKRWSCAPPPTAAAHDGRAALPSHGVQAAPSRSRGRPRPPPTALRLCDLPEALS